MSRRKVKAEVGRSYLAALPPIKFRFFVERRQWSGKVAKAGAIAAGPRNPQSGRREGLGKYGQKSVGGCMHAWYTVVHLASRDVFRGRTWSVDRGERICGRRDAAGGRGDDDEKHVMGWGMRFVARRNVCNNGGLLFSSSSFCFDPHSCTPLQ